MNLHDTGKNDGVRGSSSPTRLNPVSNYLLSTTHRRGKRTNPFFAVGV